MQDADREHKAALEKAGREAEEQLRNAKQASEQ